MLNRVRPAERQAKAIVRALVEQASRLGAIVAGERVAGSNVERSELPVWLSRHFRHTSDRVSLHRHHIQDRELAPIERGASACDPIDGDGAG